MDILLLTQVDDCQGLFALVLSIFFVLCVRKLNFNLSERTKREFEKEKKKKSPDTHMINSLLTEYEGLRG